MEAREALELRIGQRVHVHNKSRLDHAFEGKTGTVVNPHTSNGYVRVHLDGEQDTQSVLVHPESLRIFEGCERSEL